MAGSNIKNKIKIKKYFKSQQNTTNKNLFFNSVKYIDSDFSTSFPLSLGFGPKTSWKKTFLDNFFVKQGLISKQSKII